MGGALKLLTAGTTLSAPPHMAPASLAMPPRSKVDLDLSQLPQQLLQQLTDPTHPLHMVPPSAREPSAAFLGALTDARTYSAALHSHVTDATSLDWVLLHV